MTRKSVTPVLAVGAALLLAGTAVFSSFAEAQMRGDGPGGGAPGSGGAARSGPPSGGGGARGPAPINRGGPAPSIKGGPQPSMKGGGGGGGVVQGTSPPFKPGPGPSGKRPPSPGEWKGGGGRPPPPPPPRRPRPPGVSFWYWSGAPIYATDYDGCGYEYYKWRSTGSTFWRRKFYECRADED